MLHNNSLAKKIDFVVWVEKLEVTEHTEFIIDIFIYI